MVKNSLRFGFFCGVFAFLIFFFARKLGSNPFIDLNHLFADIILFGVFIFFANKDFKVFRNEGILHFWQGMTIGFVVYAVATAVFLFFLLAYFFVDPTLHSEYILEAKIYLEERSAQYIEKFGEQQYQDQLIAIEEIRVSELLFSAALKKLIVGLFVTPVISIILRKQSK